MEKTDNGRKHGPLVTGGLPRQTAAERRQKSFAIAVEKFHCDPSGQLFIEAFYAVAPPKRPSSPDDAGGERGALDPHNGMPGRIESAEDPNESAL
jgi:hypothetical protein